MRVDPSGTSPARRVRVWATICSSTQMVRSSSATRAVALPEAPAPARRSARRAFCGHDLGVFDGRLGDGGQLAGEHQHLVFGLPAAPAQPGRDLMGASAHRAGAVPKAGAPGQTEALEGAARSW